MRRATNKNVWVESLFIDYVFTKILNMWLKSYAMGGSVMDA
jgi:hypothetical protein